MPVAIYEFFAALFEYAGPWLTRLAIAHIGLVFIKTIAAFCIGVFTYTEIIQPVLDMAQANFNGIPQSITQWIGALGIDKAASILIGAYTVAAAKRLFFGKTT